MRFVSLPPKQLHASSHFGCSNPLDGRSFDLSTTKFLSRSVRALADLLGPDASVSWYADHCADEPIRPNESVTLLRSCAHSQAQESLKTSVMK